MEDKQECIMKEMEDTRSSLTEKLEVLETQVSDKIQPVADAVERVSEAAANIVENVKDTVHDVKESVEETVKSVSSAFDFRKQIERHPWVAFGVATTAGCIVATILGRRASQRSQEPSQAAASPRSKNGKAGNGFAHRSDGTDKGAKSEGFFTEELRRLKGLALGVLMGTVRDLAKKAFPPVIGSRLAEEVDSITNRLGGQPIQGAVLPESHDSGEAGEDAQDSRESQDSEYRSHPVGGVNRLRAAGSELGLN